MLCVLPLAGKTRFFVLICGFSWVFHLKKALTKMPSCGMILLRLKL